MSALIVIIDKHYDYVGDMCTKLHKGYILTFYYVLNYAYMCSYIHIWSKNKVSYIGNHPQKKSFTNYLLYHNSRENFRDTGNLIY